jgi:hypothetical protein
MTGKQAATLHSPGRPSLHKNSPPPSLQPPFPADPPEPVLANDCLRLNVVSGKWEENTIRRLLLRTELPQGTPRRPLPRCCPPARARRLAPPPRPHDRQIAPHRPTYENGLVLSEEASLNFVPSLSGEMIAFRTSLRKKRVGETEWERQLTHLRDRCLLRNETVPAPIDAYVYICSPSEIQTE